MPVVRRERGVPALNRRVALGIVALAATVAAASWVPSAAAGTVVCRGVLGPVTVEDVVVPARGSCVLEGTQVSGDVVIRHGGSLRASIDSAVQGDILGRKDATVSISRIVVGGRVECSDCLRVNIFETEIGGDVRLEGTVEAIFVNASTIHGDLEIVGGTAGAEVTRGAVLDGDLVFGANAGSLTLVRGTVGGDAVVVNNVAPLGFTFTENTFGAGLLLARNTGPSSLQLNTVAETLACFENDPAPTGSGNVAAAFAGQCVALQPTAI
jgi:hypothetical protein